MTQEPALEFPPVEPRPEYLSIPETDDDLCRALWLAVVVQAMIDIRSPGNGRRASIARQRAVDWFSAKGSVQDDFETTCDLAGINPNMTRQIVSRLISGEAENVDFRCMKKAILKNRGRENRKRYFRRARKNRRSSNFKASEEHSGSHCGSTS